MPNNCKACENEDDDEMVQCDTCDEWYHYICVGVNDEIEDHEWNCVKCRTSSIEKVQNDTNPIVAGQPSSPSSIVSKNLETSEPHSQQPSEPPQKQTEEQDNVPKSSKVQSLITNSAAGVPSQQKPFVFHGTEDNGKQKSTTSANKRVSLLLQQLEEERQLQAQRDKEYIKKKYALMKELDVEAEDNNISSNQYSYAMQNQSNEHESAATTAAKSNLFIGAREANGWNNTFGHKSANQPLVSTMQQHSVLHHPITPTSNFNASSNDKPTANQFSFSKSCETLTLNKQQLAARQLMSKEVVTFSGRVEEWPRFISWFNNTTISCGYTNTDNLSRLQHCLKEDALRTVGVRLFMPEQVPGAMKSLEMLYGRPEAIIDSLIEKIRKEPAPRMEKLQTLIRFSLSVQNACAVMIGSGLHDHLSNPSLLRELTERLPPPIRLNWGDFRKNLSAVNLLTFSDWLESVAHSASEVMPLNATNFSNRAERISQKSSLNVHQRSETQSSPTKSQPSTPLPSASTNTKCPLCDLNCGSLELCQKFLSLSLNDRWNAISRFFFCRTCLRRHGRNRCRLLKECGVDGCTFKHHRLLHKMRETTITNPAARMNCYHRLEKCCILFRIVPVTLYNGVKKIDTYAFLDDGSSISLIDEEIATQLNVSGEPQPLCLKWTSNTHRTEHSSKVINIQISSISSKKKYEVSNLHTVKSLDLPKQSINAEELCRRHNHLKNLPIQSYNNAKPRLLLGLDQWKLGIPLRSHEGRSNEPVASKTRLGWTVYGSCTHNLAENEKAQLNYQNFHNCDCQDAEEDKLTTLFKDFIAIDLGGINVKKILRSADDEKAISIISQNMTRRAEANNFVVPLLWKGTVKQMPDSRPMAERRLKHLEKRLSCNQTLKENLDKQIQDYVRKQYARKLKKDEVNTRSYRTWYLPIFPVVNQNKPEKVRIVWDAAATVNGVSLNTMLLSGPDIVPSLLSVLMRFRERKIAICADIKEMFHQVWIQSDDQHAQRFLWRSTETDEIEEYVMQVMTFGSTCSPFCAQYVKNTNAKNFQTKYPRAVKGIIENHYVDDYLDSVNSEEEAVELAKNVIFIHSQAGFDIRNFLSNSEKVLHSLGEKSACYEKKFSNWHLLSGYEKILGMWWCPSTDTFSFAIKSHTSKPVILADNWPTKRELLKVLMSVFDPLGLIANYLILLKILLQEVWLSAVAWDEKIHQQHFEKWCKWKKLIPDIKNITIERRYLKDLTFTERLTIQMHVFVDASETAYAAVVYFRFSDGDSVEISLVAAKTKVAPLKIMSIPRLELEAAVLGVRLAKSIANSHTLQINDKYFWSDSKTVLNWINSDNRRYKQFVAFRVGEILEETEAKNWRWIQSKANVADEATKWQCSHDFGSNSRWYKGPNFLYDPIYQWPSEFVSTEPTEEEIRHVSFHHVDRVMKIIEVLHFSKWVRLLRVTAQIFRYVRNLMSKRLKTNTDKILIRTDLHKAENYLFKVCQSEVFSEEILILKSIQKDIKDKRAGVERTSTIYKLTPYLDENSVMRVKGRIDAAYGVPLNTKRPIILPNQHHITELIVRSYHERFCHQNDETVINELRQKYFIPKLRALLPKIKKKCQFCKNMKCVPQPPIMGDLPPGRLQSFTRPFSFIGIDYFGPMFVTVGRRSEKRWGVLITCMTVRAVHIEVAHSLTTDSCIMALQRFISRRGWPLEINSDNGTNFRGASNELKEAMNQIDQDKLATKFTGPNLTWKFIPPSSPHMGGSWERLIRSVKRTLCFITPTRNPSDELLVTMLAEVERIINTRPLTYVPLGDSNEEALTPNHFLLGSSNGEKTFGELNDDGALLKKNWLISSQFANRFWRRWVSEYLPDLTRRTKWFSMTRPIREGDIVIIADPDNPRNTWPKGTILKTIPGKDGQIRSAVVKTATGVYTRPTAKLAVLDIGRFDDDDEKPIQNTAFTGGSVVKSGNSKKQSDALGIHL